MSYKLAVAIFFDTRDCKPLKKYRNNQYSYSSCALYYFFPWGEGGGWALIRGWALKKYFLGVGRLFEAGRLLTFSTPKVGAYSRLGA